MDHGDELIEQGLAGREARQLEIDEQFREKEAANAGAMNHMRCPSTSLGAPFGSRCAMLTNFGVACHERAGIRAV